MKNYSLFLLLVVLFVFSSCSKEEAIEIVKSNDTPIELKNQSGDLEKGFEISMDRAEDVEKYQSESGNERWNPAYFRFHTLKAALKCTGLDAAVLSGNKTIYAPSDAAFADLGLDASNVCTTLTTQQLTDILLYHVSDGIVKYNETGCVELLDGNVAQLTRKNWYKRFINGTRNYISWTQYGANYKLRVYAIKDVLMPPADNIVATASSVATFSSLVAAVTAADPAIAAALTDEDAVYTVFAPTDQAFADLLSALGYATLNDLVAGIGVANLSTVLLYHVFDGCAFSNDLVDGQSIPTLQGESIDVDLANLSLIDASTTPAGLDASGLDVLTSNGIVHTIDKVLLPQAIVSQL